MKLQRYFLIFLQLTLLLAGCADPYVIERRRTGGQELTTFSPADNKDRIYSEVLAKNVTFNKDKSAVQFNMLLLAPFNQEVAPAVLEETRTNKRSFIQTDWALALMVAPLFACMYYQSNCFVGEEGAWKGELRATGPAVPTGVIEYREKPLQGQYKGTILLRGMDEKGKPVGTASLSHVFRAENTVSFAEASPSFTAKPEQITVEGQVKINKRPEKISFVLEKNLVAEINYGDYAWKTQREVVEIKAVKMRIEAIEKKLKPINERIAELQGVQQDLQQKEYDRQHLASQARESNIFETALSLSAAGPDPRSKVTATTAFARSLADDPADLNAGTDFQIQQRRLLGRLAKLQEERDALLRSLNAEKKLLENLLVE